MELPIIIEVRDSPHKRESKFSDQAKLEIFLAAVESAASMWGLDVNHFGPREAMIDFFIREREKNGSG